MDENLYAAEINEEYRRKTADLSQYTTKTFLLMFLGLLMTFGTAFFLGCTRAGLNFLLGAYSATGGAIFIILMFVELIVAVGMTAMLHKISPAAAMGCFFLYSFLTGATFSVLFLSYDLTVMIYAFGLTALYFAGMAIFACVTHIDLSNYRSILLGGLLFLIAANLLMLFIPAFQLSDQLLCTVGVVVFLGYTAYDTQKLRDLYFSFDGNEEMQQKAAIYSALQLYLDFINLFLYILKLLGTKNRKRR